MERREFLGVGAAIGASAVLPENSVASDTEAVAPASRPMPAGADECQRNMDNVEWAIPAGQLNTLWSLLWPRVAAGVWAEPAKFTWPTPMTNNDISGDIRNWISVFINESLGSPAFLDALGRLDAFLASPGRPPIYYLGAGGYDFLLSERGVELWAPPNPRTNGDPQQKLLDHYEYRRTGRPSIGVGGVMSGGAQPFILSDAPTGPGQIDTIDPDPAVLQATLQAMMVGSMGAPPLQFCAVLHGARAAIDRLQREVGSGGRGGGGRGGGFPVSDVEGRLRALLQAVVSTDPAERATQLGRIQSAVLAFPGGFEVARILLEEFAAPEQPCQQLTVGLYECTAERERCWVVSGAVYRGLLEQFPLFVAEAWGDNPLRNVRNIDPRPALQERMEMIFTERMRFEFLDLANLGGGPAIGTDAGNRWDAEQIMVTNSGIFFPSQIGTNGQAPGVEQLLSEIIAGRAGNPVFTDSSRSQ